MIDLTSVDLGDLFVAPRKCRKTAIVQAVQVHEPFKVVTKEGTMEGKAGDYLMIGVKGERYPCEQDAFSLSYEWVE